MSIFTTSQQIILCNGLTQTVPAGALNFLTVVFQGVATIAYNAKTPVSVNLQAFFMSTNTAQPGTGTLVLDLFVNNLFVKNILTIPAGAGAGSFQNTAVSYTLNAGDTFRVNITNNAALASAGINTWSWLLN